MDLASNIHQASVAVEEQHEKLRRLVDEWSVRGADILQDGDPEGFPIGGLPGDMWRDAVGVSAEPLELVAIPDLISTGNVPFTKLLTVLAYLCCEIASVKEQVSVRFFPQLLVFGVHGGGDSMEGTSEGEAQEALAEMLPELQALLGQVARLRGLLVNLVRQLAALSPPSAKQSRLYASFRDNIHLHRAVEALSEGFGLLAALDEIVAHNGALSHALSSFIRMVQTVRGEPSAFGLESDQVAALQQAASALEDAILAGGFFQRCIQEDFCTDPELSPLRSNRCWVDEMSLCLREAIASVGARLAASDSVPRKERPHDRRELAGHLAFFVFLSWIYPDGLDKKLMGQAWDVHAKAPFLPIFSIVGLRPLSFLAAQLPPWALAPPWVKSPVKVSARELSMAYLTSLDGRLNKDVKDLGKAVSVWVAQMDNCLPLRDMSMPSALRRRLQLLREGLHITTNMRTILLTTIDLHGHLEVPLGKEQVRLLHRLAEMLKAVESTFHRRHVAMVQSLGPTLHLLAADLAERLQPLKEALEAELASSTGRPTGLARLTRTLTRSRDADERLLDGLAAVSVALEMVRGGAARQRRITFRLSLDIIASLKKLREEEMAAITELSELLAMAADLGGLIPAATDCSFLLWSRHMLAPGLAGVFTEIMPASDLQYILAAFLDGVRLLRAGGGSPEAIQACEGEIERALAQEIVEPLSRAVETDLRFHVHSVHDPGSVAVDPSKTGVRDLSSLLCMRPLRLLSKELCVAARVEAYLSAAFYDHTAVALHDWKTYDEMRHVAEGKYGLEVDPVALPSQTREQGLDVLQVVAKLPLFVSCYHYDLHSQVFIEKLGNARDRKHLLTIGVRHVASSLGTHGPGVAHTTVNMAYSLLARKFAVISQFLFDDHIKSRLAKEGRSWKEITADGKGHEYPLERAEKFRKDIGKLGVTGGGLSFLDAFRGAVAEVGNALGLVRMVRGGALQLATSAARYLPGGNEDVSFQEAAQNGPFETHTREAAALLDAAVANIQAGTSAQKTDYFRILVEVFSPELRGGAHAHLRPLFLMGPALILSAMEAMLLARERLHKRTRDAAQAAFTDDGFLLGLAYILRVLDQDQHFDSLHWFDSARKHYLGEKTRLEEVMDPDGGGGMSGLKKWSQKVASLTPEETHNIQAVLKRVNACLTEIDLMFYTFGNARVFFQQ